MSKRLESHPLDDDGKLRNKWHKKKWNAKQEGVKCLLTFDEYASLVEEAGIKSSNIGVGSEKYHLSRTDDIGDYTLDNSKFITCFRNLSEKNPRRFERSPRLKLTADQKAERLKNRRKRCWITDGNIEWRVSVYRVAEFSKIVYKEGRLQ